MIRIASCFLAHVVLYEWIIDSSVTHHVATHRDLFSHFHKIDNIKKDKVNISTGAKVDISHVRETQVIKDEAVVDVLFVPDVSSACCQCLR